MSARARRDSSYRLDRVCALRYIEDMESRRSKIGSVVIALFVILPAAILSGFMAELYDLLPFTGWLAVAGLGGLIGGALLAEGLEMWGGIGGLMSGLLMPFAVSQYVDFRIGLSSTFFSIELLIPGLVAAAPGFATYFIGKKIHGE
ncbi:MAG: hypothetical protein AAFP04_10340 [Myxococcota bacterium]